MTAVEEQDHQVTIAVPLEHLEAFQEAVVGELWLDGWRAQETTGELSASRTQDSVDADLDALADVRDTAQHFSRVVALADQAFGAGDPSTVVSDPATLGHAAEKMARNAAGELEQRLEISPYGDDSVQTIRRLTDAISWASELASEMHGKREVKTEAA